MAQTYRTYQGAASLDTLGISTFIGVCLLNTVLMASVKLGSRGLWLDTHARLFKFFFPEKTERGTDLPR